MEDRDMEKAWWNSLVAYQVYPKSFMDSNGDGIGDLKGVISKLDYLKDLGIDMIWLSPVYKSPFVDQGYDISDYYAIAEEFGTMDDMDELIRQARKRRMYVVMDLVINHCSNQHPWFQKALEDPTGEYGDYFYFRPGKGNQPPCNYRSYFGGSCWEKVEGKNLYYLHYFSKEQPDLNWENPRVRQQLHQMINWWLGKGLAGFRIDAIMNIKKDLEFKNLEPDGPDGLADCEKVISRVTGIDVFLKELNQRVFQRRNVFTVGEVFGMRKNELSSFIGEHGYFSTIFDFDAHLLGEGGHGWYDAPRISFSEWKSTIIHSQLEAQNIGLKATIIENHDEPRGVSRFLPDYAKNGQGAKMLGTVHMLLRGMPFIYQGQEIGMTNAVWRNVQEFDDINTIEQYQRARKAGKSEREALLICGERSRDNARTPMQWSGENNGGFTTGKPWIKLNDNYKFINVESQNQDDFSVLQYYKKLIGLRKSEEYKELFTYGDFIPVYEDKPSLFGFYRKYGKQKVLVVANFGRQEVTIELTEQIRKVLIHNQPKLLCEGTLVLQLPPVSVLVGEV